MTMKIFISWSGNRSKAVAELINDWIKCVIQASKPWISSQNIESGSIWFNEITDALKDVSIGIVCLTQENKDKPWILFESGALIKGLTHSRVCTFLIDLNPEDLENPLAQIHHTTSKKESVRKLVATINNNLTESLSDKTLDEVFETYWPVFEEKFNTCLKKHKPLEEPPKRSADDILIEILKSTRNLSNRMRVLENENENTKTYLTNNIKISKNAMDWATRGIGSHLSKSDYNNIMPNNKSTEEMINYLVKNRIIEPVNEDDSIDD